MNQQIQEALNVLLTTVITGAISVIGALISVYLNKLKDKAVASANAIKDDSTKKLVQNAINRLNELVFTNVKAAQETLVKEIIQNAEDGYSKEDLLAVKDIVRENILKQLSQDSKDLIAKEIANIDSYIDEKIEVVLAEIKLMDQQQNCSY